MRGVDVTEYEKRQYLLESLRGSKEYRDWYVGANISNDIAFQIRAMRQSRGWTQSGLGSRVGKRQEAIVRLEDPNYGNYTLGTLKRLASVFDVALVVRFEPFSRLVNYVTHLGHADLEVPCFQDERLRTEHKYRRHITIDPAIMDGGPCLDGTRIPAETIARAYDNGWSAERIAQEWSGVDRAALLVCCWYVATYGTRAPRRRWKMWGEKAHALLWRVIDVDVSDIGLPPQKEQN